MRSSVGTALLRGLLAATLVTGVGVAGAVTAQGADPCQPVVSPVACENSKPGNPKSEWDISGSGSSNLQGFATDISVNVGETVRFKVSTPARSYRLDIYRLGYYAGNGARKVATVAPSASLPQNQPNCLTQTSTGLVDCGNWGLSASWQVPADAVSGIYIAKLVRTDGTSGSSHIVFVVRDDNGGADILFQTSDTTWQAYNQYGGNSLYTGSPAGRAYKVSYNRPFTTRGYAPEDWVFNAEYPMVRWLEANGYDVSYATDVDTDRRGVAGLTSHETFLSVGHDEYWSGGQRANVEAARDAGVNLGFFSGNEVFWKTRWENSIDTSGTPYRTLVSYKETHANAKIDPNPAWTGTWRDPRFSPPADGGRPENALTGTIFKVNSGTTAIQVPSADGKMRFWRGTSVANLTAGATATLSAGTLGYEWDEDADNGFRPGGLVRLSTTTASGVDVLQDYGSSYGSGSATHHLTLYRAASGALVFGAGTIQWPWGLDSVHDRGTSTVSTPMRQATVNLLADMGVQPVTLQSGLAAATASTDSTGPQVSITSPAAGSSQPQGSTVPVTGTATDVGGQVGAVEVSKDGGATWHPATGRSSWSYSWSVGAGTSATLLVRAADDSGNIGPQQSLTVTLAQPTCPCTIWDPSSAPQSPAEDDNSAIEVGVKFRPAVNGTISAIRFYKGSGNTGTHVGHLWTAGGQQLATVNFSGETATGWQQANLASPVTVTAGTTYVASYYAPVGRYAEDEFYFQDSGVDAGPIRALRDAEDGPNGVFRYGSGGGFPSGDWRSSNYWVDVVFTPTGSSDVTPPAVTARTPAAGATGVAVATAVSATFNEALATPLPTVAMTGAGGSPVAGSTSYNAATRTITFQPSAALAYSTIHNVTITGARDAAGNITPPVTWSFTTAAEPPSDVTPPAVTARTPAAGATGVAVATAVSATFNEALATPLPTVAMTGAGGSPVAGSTSYNAATRTITFQPSAALAYSTIHNVTITGARDAAGNITPPVTWSFTTAAEPPSDVTPPAVTARTPAAGATGVAVATAVSATFNEALATPLPTVAMTGAGGSPVAGSTSYNAATRTITFQPSAALAYSTIHNVTITGARDAAGNITPPVTWSFTTAAEPPPGPTCPCTIWPSTATPGTLADPDNSAVELGVKFRADVSGFVTGVRFYKGSGNTGTHLGRLWSASGTQLASGTFTNETASGWQTLTFATPVAITAGTTYVASYYAPVGRYSVDEDYFSSAGTDNAPLHALADGIDGGNGVYRYGSGGGFPTSTYNASNYWVDVVVTTSN